MKVPRFELKPDEKAISKVVECLREGSFVFGSAVEEFEMALNKSLNALHSASTSNGFAALQLCIESMGISNSKIVVPAASTCSAILNSVRASGNSAIFCDLDVGSASLSHFSLQEIIKENDDVSLIIHPNHFGIVSDVSKNASLGIPLIEDSAQSIFTDAKLGRFDSIAKIYSFYPTKGLNSIDGGAVVSNDTRLIEEVKKRRYYSGLQDDDGVARHNLKMLNINCAYGSISLADLEANMKLREEMFLEYSSILANHQIEILGAELDYIPQKLMVRFEKGEERDSFLKHMQLAGIGCSHELVLSTSSEDFVGANTLVNTTCSIPFYESLNPAKLQCIRESIENFRSSL